MCPRLWMRFTSSGTVCFFTKNTKTLNRCLPELACIARRIHFTYFLGESIGDHQSVFGLVLFSDEGSDIDWPRRAWFVFEALVIGLHLLVIEFHFNLRGKGNICSFIQAKTGIRNATKEH